MDFLASKQMVTFVETGWEEGSCTVEGQAMVALVRIRPIGIRLIEIKIHGERLIWVEIGSRDFNGG